MLTACLYGLLESVFDKRLSGGDGWVGGWDPKWMGLAEKERKKCEGTPVKQN